MSSKKTLNQDPLLLLNILKLREKDILQSKCISVKEAFEQIRANRQLRRNTDPSCKTGS